MLLSDESLDIVVLEVLFFLILIFLSQMFYVNVYEGIGGAISKIIKKYIILERNLETIWSPNLMLIYDFRILTTPPIFCGRQILNLEK